MIETSRSGNPFEDHHRLIVRLDVLARNEDLQSKLARAREWDLIICDPPSMGRSNDSIWKLESDLPMLAKNMFECLNPGGQILFTRGIYSVPLSSVFFVKVGAVSGADEIFTNAELGKVDFVCSRTATKPLSMQQSMP